MKRVKQQPDNRKAPSPIPRSPGGGHGNPLQYSCLENPHGLRSQVGYSPWGCKESDTTDRLSVHTHTHTRPKNCQYLFPGSDEGPQSGRVVENLSSKLKAAWLPFLTPHPKRTVFLQEGSLSFYIHSKFIPTD